MDWKIGLFILQIIVICANIATFMIIRFNDLRHLSNSVKEITAGIKELNTEFKKVSDKVIAMDATCKETHKR